MCCSVFGAKEQTNMPDGTLLKDIIRTVVDAPAEQVDPTVMQYLDAIYNQVAAANPRFKMYVTENTYILLKLDTVTGQVRMVQYGMGEISSRLELAVDDTSPLCDHDVAVN